MITKKDIAYIRRRKKVWDQMGYTYKSPNQLRKNHQLSCNCSACRAKRFEKKYRHRIERMKNRINGF